ncbi:MAG: hypothetical protein ACRETC_07905 [Gammaproteobacteria bacterium]
MTKDQALETVEKLFRLDDGDDFDVVQMRDGLRATRHWLIYLVLAASSGHDYWDVQAKEILDGVIISVQVNRNAQAVTPMPTTGGNWTATTGAMAGAPIDGTAIYDVFFARLDYLLGKRKHWMTCKQSDERVKKGIVWGANNEICNSFNVADKNPEHPELNVQALQP